MTPRIETIGDATLYLGDCREILPTLERVDAVVTDPPYGIGESAAKNNRRGLLAAPTDYGSDDWDHQPCPDEVIAWIRESSSWQIIFGGNYFNLPPAPCWLIWDKEINGDFADAEMAWTNLPRAIRLKRWMWNGMLRKGAEQRFHLTQKPLGIMEWCIGFVPDATTILDPFMGSGTTGVAALKLGRKFIGIEIEPKYFDIACRRIEEAWKQPRLFEEPKPKAVQTDLLELATLSERRAGA